MQFRTLLAAILSAAVLVSAAPVALDAREPAADAIAPSWKRGLGAPSWKRDASVDWKRDASVDWKREPEANPGAADW